MYKLDLLVNWVNHLINAAQDILVPEDHKISKLISLSPALMRDLLPKSPVYSKDLFVLFDYQNKIVRLIVKSIKYKNNANLRKRIAGYFCEELVEICSDIALFEGSAPILVPMPMAKKEKTDRGFNQTEELVKEIKKISGGGLEISFSVLKKVRETDRQTKLSREEREKNLKGSMCAFSKSEATMKMQHPERSEGEYLNNKVKNRVIIVLDDVYTTGASIGEARRALLAAGAKRVIGLFIAH